MPGKQVRTHSLNSVDIPPPPGWFLNLCIYCWENKMQTQMHVAVPLATGPSQQLQKMLLWIRHPSELQNLRVGQGWRRSGKFVLAVRIQSVPLN